MKKKVLICGATGFLGRHLTERFASREDCEVVATYRSREPWAHPRLSWLRADLTNSADVERVLAGVDVVVQAAATTSGAKDIVSRPTIHVTDNAVMNSLLFRAAHEKGVKQLVFFSCTIMYPSSEQPQRETGFDANAAILPAYFGAGWTKVYLEKMAEFYSRLGTTRYLVLRHSNVYGPHDKFDLERSHVFGATMTKVMRAQEGKVVVWGDGSETRDLLYISDLVDLVESAVDRDAEPFTLVNAGGGEAISIADLVHRIIQASGRTLQIEFDPSQPTLKNRLQLDSSLAREKFGWAPRISLDEGIRRTMSWYRDHIL